MLPGLPPPVAIAGALVNEQEVTLDAFGAFTTEVTLEGGTSPISATGIATDETTVTASIMVECGEPDTLECEVKINSPEDSTIFCADSVFVEASMGTIGDNIEAACTINGIEAEVDEEGGFHAVVPLSAGANEIVAVCKLTDTPTGADTTCGVKIVVFADPTPPVCELDFSDFPTIRGKVFDPESGIDFIEVVTISNRILKIAGQEVSEITSIEFDGEEEIEFVLEKIDVNQRGTFTLRAVNGGGCDVSCDPIDLTLNTANSPCNFTFFLPHTDRTLYVENHGLTRIELTMNGKPLSLVAS